MDRAGRDIRLSQQIKNRCELLDIARGNRADDDDDDDDDDDGCSAGDDGDDDDDDNDGCDDDDDDDDDEEEEEEEEDVSILDEHLVRHDFLLVNK